ncbi:MAG: hypothetical protein LBI42_09700 [Chitinispirillales bacterium]|jgi:hypothetical protein|nr:hypothetical protein [Chitinispirillales bacterium]
MKKGSKILVDKLNTINAVIALSLLSLFVIWCFTKSPYNAISIALAVMGIIMFFGAFAFKIFYFERKYNYNFNYTDSTRVCKAVESKSCSFRKCEKNNQECIFAFDIDENGDAMCFCYKKNIMTH